MTKSKKCTCGAKRSITCPNCSNVKMVILLKTGFNHLKIESQNGKRYNPVWYNHLNKNNLSFEKIKGGMLRRFLNSENTQKYKGAVNKLNFYSNTNGELLETVVL